MLYYKIIFKISSMCVLKDMGSVQLGNFDGLRPCGIVAGGIRSPAYIYLCVCGWPWPWEMGTLRARISLAS